MAYNSETDKIDKLAVDGLLGTANSLAYKVHEIEKHLHNYERWMGVAVTPNAEIHVADWVKNYTALAPITTFQIDAGNNDWGAWVQILGSSDTPVIAGQVYYDLHDLAFSGNERAGIYIMQIGFGTSGAQALTDNTFTTLCIGFDGANYQKNHPVLAPRFAAGTKAWARCICPTQNTGTLNFYFGLHEYIG